MTKKTKRTLKKSEDTTQQFIQHFYLDRHEDETGMSGTGRVAEGVVLPNGMALMWWIKPPYSIQIYESLTKLMYIHGHGEKKTTSFVFTDKPLTKKKKS